MGVSREVASRTIAVMGVVVLMVLATRAAEAQTYHTVALTGEAAPGMPAGVTFSGFRTFYYHPGLEENVYLDTPPMIGSAGEVSFFATLEGTGVSDTNDTAIYSQSTGSLTALAREGDAAPSTSGTFGQLSSSFIRNSAGQTLFYAQVDSDWVLYEHAGGSTNIVVQEGDPEPGGSTYSSISDYAYNANGDIAFSGYAGGRYAAYSNYSGSIALIARENDTAAGMVDVQYDRFDNIAFSDNGRLAFPAELKGSVTDDNDTALFTSNSAGTVSLIAREGSQAADVATGVVYGNFSRSSDHWVNDAGQITFLTNLTGTGITSDNEDALYMAEGGTPMLIAREGNTVSSLGTGYEYGSINYKPAMNSEGKIAFRAGLKGDAVGSDDEALFLYNEGATNLIMKKGNAAPGLTPGTTFNGFGSSPTINSAGQVAILAFTTGPDNGTGLWVTDLDGDLMEVVRTGELFDVDETAGIDERTISDIDILSYRGDQSGKGTGFNDDGVITFYLAFTDGSEGIFTADTLALVIPEPTTAALLLTGMGLLLRRRRLC